MRKDWIECNLGDLITLKNGYAFKSSKYIESGIPVIRIGDIKQGFVTSDEAKTIEENEEYDNFIIEKNDILIAMSGATTGKFGYYRSENKAYQNQRVGNLIPHSKELINKDYIYNLLHSLKYQIEKDAYGGAQPNISAGKIHELKTRLASLPEQRAIVKKIESLFSDLDKGIADLKKAQEQLKVYRQAVLKKAFEGELTREWREQQTDLPSADELFEQIKEERQKHYEQQVEKWEEAVKDWEENGKEGKKPSKPKVIKSVEDFSQSELSKLDLLPNGWSWVRLGNVFQVFVGSTPSRRNSEYWEGGTINWVSSGEVTFSSIFYTKEKITIEGLNNSSTTVHPIGTVMLAMIGEGKTRGQAGILEIDACHNQNTAAIRVSEMGYSPKYLFYYLFLKYERNRSIGSGNNQKALNQGRIMAFDYPLCSSKEQLQIVQEIESRLSVCDKVEESISESLEKANSLRQSILKKAFEGTLLSEAEINECKAAADYEPASVLLEKIKQEKKKK